MNYAKELLNNHYARFYDWDAYHWGFVVTDTEKLPLKSCSWYKKFKWCRETNDYLEYRTGFHSSIDRMLDQAIESYPASPSVRINDYIELRGSQTRLTT